MPMPSISRQIRDIDFLRMLPHRAAAAPLELISQWRHWQAWRKDGWKALVVRSIALRTVAARDGSLWERCHAPYIARSFDLQTRYDILASHYRLIDERFPARLRSCLLAGRGIHIANLALDRGTTIYLSMRAPLLASSGELGLYLLTEDKNVLASCTLTFGGKHGVLIGALHGSWSFMGKQPIRDFTRATCGLRPKNLLLSLVYTLQAFLGLESIRAVSEQARPSGDVRRRGPGTGQDAFWRENGGDLDRQGCYVLPALETHRSPMQLPSKRRSARRRREAFRAYACDQMLFALHYTSLHATNALHESAAHSTWSAPLPESTGGSAMLPALKTIKSGLHQATETLAAELARPGDAMPAWSALQWQLAAAAAVTHGVSPLLSRYSLWADPVWRAFLAEQREHVARRHQRIVALLRSIDQEARSTGLAAMPLKGSALHALGLYTPGDRPMADIDLLVREEDVDQACAVLQKLGYVEAYVQWKHRVFKPANSSPVAGLGEHCDTPINIELHTRIRERLPVSLVDITERIFPAEPHPGLNAYPSNGALMSHLLLHAAGNICARSLRLLHLNDISLLATRMTIKDWNALWDARAADAPWWALPPLCLVQRYYRNAVPQAVLKRLRTDCPVLLRLQSQRQTLTTASCSKLWLDALPGIEWSRSFREAAGYFMRRLRPTAEDRQERADMVRTQLWLQGQDWVVLPHSRRILARLAHPVPRMDMLYAVNAALESYAHTA